MSWRGYQNSVNGGGSGGGGGWNGSAIPPPSFNPSAPPANTSAPVCYSFLSPDGCRFGHRCRFSHSAPPQSLPAFPPTHSALPPSHSALPQSTSAFPPTNSALPHSLSAFPPSHSALPQPPFAFLPNHSALPQSISAFPPSHSAPIPSPFFGSAAEQEGEEGAEERGEEENRTEEEEGKGDRVYGEKEKEGGDGEEGEGEKEGEEDGGEEEREEEKGPKAVGILAEADSQRDAHAGVHREAHTDTRREGHAGGAHAGGAQAGGERVRVSVMSYNVLASCHAAKFARELYPGVPKGVLHWNQRRHGIVKEIKQHSPDLICLQEVDSHADLCGAMNKLGYDSIFQCRTGANKDGCANFWNTKRGLKDIPPMFPSSPPPLPSSSILSPPLPSSPLLFHPLPSSSILSPPLPSSPLLFHPLPSSSILSPPLPSSPLLFRHAHRRWSCVDFQSIEFAAVGLRDNVPFSRYLP
ncbi:unnamed protein product [Closterium sp. Naga37s-1]|nr:unnamed protein product [Closterium sp. Naga37s-1]